MPLAAQRSRQGRLRLLRQRCDRGHFVLRGPCASCLPAALRAARVGPGVEGLGGRRRPLLRVGDAMPGSRCAQPIPLSPTVIRVTDPSRDQTRHVTKQCARVPKIRARQIGDIWRIHGRRHGRLSCRKISERTDSRACVSVWVADGRRDGESEQHRLTAEREAAGRIRCSAPAPKGREPRQRTATCDAAAKARRRKQRRRPRTRRRAAARSSDSSPRKRGPHDLADLSDSRTRSRKAPPHSGHETEPFFIAICDRIFS